jgi:hypothetical protein
VTRRIAALVGLLILTAPAASRGQDQGRVPAGGSEAFRFALHLHDFKPSGVADVFADPEHAMIVVLGDVRAPNQFQGVVDGRQLREFMTSGGAILVASDGPVGARPQAAGRGPGWPLEFGVDIQITPRRLIADREHSYRGQSDKAFVTPLPRTEWGNESPFDLFKDQDKEGALPIATHNPSEMSVPPGGGRYLLKNLAKYVEGTHRVGVRDPIEPGVNHFAISLETRPELGDRPNGRIIVLANRGVFTNEMMGFVKDPGPGAYHFDNGNLNLTKRTIEWLQQNGPAKRTKCLFIEDGRVVDRFAVELPPNARPPIPNIPPDVIANWLLNAANPIVEEAQERDVFNRFLDRWLGFPRLVRLFLTVVTVLFILACLRRLVRGYRKAEPTATLTPAARDSLLPRGGVVRQRTAAQLEVGNLYEAARRRVRERFDVLGGRPILSGQMPPILTANDLPDGPLLYQSVRWLWTLGYGETPLAVPPADWDRTNVLLERVTARAARGDWSFGQEAN